MIDTRKLANRSYDKVGRILRIEVYTNITIRGAEQAQAAEVVRAAPYRAWISPTVAGLT